MMKVKTQTCIRCYGWIPLTTINISATHCQVFSKYWQENRNFKVDMKIQTYLHCYAWIALTMLIKSATHCPVFSENWEEKKKSQGGDKDSNLHSLLWLDSFDNH